MKSISQGNFKMAMSSIRATRWRSLLTMMGVIVGIASVVTVVSIGEGIKHQVTGQINKLGKDLIIVRPGTVGASTSQTAFASLNNLSIESPTDSLTSSETKLVRSTAGVNLAVPLAIVPGQAQLGGRKISDSIIIGTTQNAPSALNQSLLYGGFFSSGDANPNVAVLGQNVANELFPGQVPLGHSFTIAGQTFVVRGEFDQFDSAPLSIDANFNNVVFIPFSTAEQLTNNNAPIYEILARPNKPNDTNKVVSAITSRLQTASNGLNNFSVLKQSESLAVSNSILNLLTTFIGGIAAISLIVGGIGIMDVMLVSVTERTREIGIRKAIGATNKQILGQFLTEAAILSLFGGIGGLLLSLILNLGLRIFTSLEPLIVWQIMLLATAVSLLIGVIFGIIPAIKAASKDPIEALRYQ